jgi:uncharacterized protein YndB with AHSA1/START domain
MEVMSRVPPLPVLIERENPMNYTYRYPGSIQLRLGRRYGQIEVCETFLAETHELLMERIDHPMKTLSISLEIEAGPEAVWEVAAGSIATFFGYQPAVAGVVGLNGLGSLEGGRHVVYRTRDGKFTGRIGEVLVNLPGSQLVISDIDAGDQTTGGSFPGLYSMRLEEGSEPGRTTVHLSHTALGLRCTSVLQLLISQIKNIARRVEEEV